MKNDEISILAAALSNLINGMYSYENYTPDIKEYSSEFQSLFLLIQMCADEIEERDSIIDSIKLLSEFNLYSITLVDNNLKIILTTDIGLKPKGDRFDRYSVSYLDHFFDLDIILLSKKISSATINSSGLLIESIKLDTQEKCSLLLSRINKNVLKLDISVT